MVVDLRSDAVTQPTEAMWEAMRPRHLEWSHGGDRSIAFLERLGASVGGTESSLFVPSGTMANTLALLAWTRPGDQFIVDQHAHVITSEDAAFARLAGIHPLLVQTANGHFRSDQVVEVLESGMMGHQVHPSLVWLENTHTMAGGSIIPVESVRQIAEVSHQRNIKVHVDGARIFNATAADRSTPADFGQAVDSLTINLNKGLSAPAGALLCGPEPFVAWCRQRLSGLGGILSQAGLLAAAGRVAIETMQTQPISDNNSAVALGEQLARNPEIAIVFPIATNIVVLRSNRGLSAENLVDRLASKEILVLQRDSATIRLVTHRHIDVSRAPIVGTAITSAFSTGAR